MQNCFFFIILKNNYIIRYQRGDRDGQIEFNTGAPDSSVVEHLVGGPGSEPSLVCHYFSYPITNFFPFIVFNCTQLIDMFNFIKNRHLNRDGNNNFRQTLVINTCIHTFEAPSGVSQASGRQPCSGNLVHCSLPHTGTLQEKMFQMLMTYHFYLDRTEIKKTQQHCINEYCKKLDIQANVSPGAYTYT